MLGNIPDALIDEPQPVTSPTQPVRPHRPN